MYLFETAKPSVNAESVNDSSTLCTRINRHNYQRIVKWGWKGMDFYRLYYNFTPGAAIVYQGRRYELVPENIYLLPRMTSKDMFVASMERPFRQFYIHFQLADNLPGFHQVVVLPVVSQTIELINHYVRVAELPEARHLRGLLAQTILNQTLLRLPDNCFMLGFKGDHRIKEVCEIISASPEKHLSNDELARIAGMSRNGFVRRFTSVIGESPQHYCRRKRVELACELFNAGWKDIDKVAEKSGFADRYHFSRIFKQISGSPPGLFVRMLNRTER